MAITLEELEILITVNADETQKGLASLKGDLENLKNQTQNTGKSSEAAYTAMQVAAVAAFYKIMQGVDQCIEKYAELEP